MRTQRDVRAAQARFEAYDRELSKVSDAQSFKSEQASTGHTSKLSATPPAFIPVQTAPPGVAQLAQAVQDSIRMNRLSTPEPAVFSGDPKSFIEWKSTFIALIEQKNITAADKLYYLKRYVTGQIGQGCNPEMLKD